MPEPIPEQIETVVIGGGQAGLATSYHLARRGLEHVVLDERGRVGDVWRERWDSLSLFTPARYDGLPGLAFPERATSYPTKDQMADYLEDYATQQGLPVRTGVAVRRVTRTDGSWNVEHDEGSTATDNVVVATGSHHHPRMPDFADAIDPDIMQLHSTEYHRPSQIRDGAVLVVGAGNSGAEIAMDLSAGHEVWLSGRDPGQEPTRAGSFPDRLLTPFIWLMANRVLTVRTPMGRKARDHFMDPPRGIPLGRVRRKDLSAAGIERVPRTTGVEDGRPVVADGRTLDVANVIWCTGFVADFGWIERPIFGEYGYPAHTRGVVESEPGLYFMGLPFQYALSSALVGGVGRDATHIVKHLAARRQAAKPSPIVRS